MMMKLRANLSRVADFVFGYNFFISYKRADGENYPQLLEQTLTKLGYAVFLDTRSYAAGEELSTATRRRIRMSSTVIVLGRPGAFADSPWVLQEVREAHLAGCVLVMINFGGVFQSLHVQGPEQLARLKELLTTMAFCSKGTAKNSFGDPAAVCHQCRSGVSARRAMYMPLAAAKQSVSR